MAVEGLSETAVTFRRLQKFLLLPEMRHKQLQHGPQLDEAANNIHINNPLHAPTISDYTPVDQLEPPSNAISNVAEPSSNAKVRAPN